MAGIDLKNLAQVIEKDYYKPLKHLLPYSKPHSEETAGGRLLNQLQSIIPWEKMLSSTHLKNLYANPTVCNQDRDNVLKALRVCYDLRREYAQEIAAQKDYQKKLDAILKYRQIHCLDTAYLTTSALIKQEYPAYFIDLIDPYDNRGNQYVSHHSITLYSEDKSKKLDEMFSNLTDPDVRIVDYWINDEGNAQQMLQLLNKKFNKDIANLLVCSVNTQILSQKDELHKKFVIEPNCSRGHEQFPLLSAKAYELLFERTSSFNLQKSTQFKPTPYTNGRNTHRS